MIYISIIQTGFRRKSEDLFESVSLTCSICQEKKSEKLTSTGIF